MSQVLFYETIELLMPQLIVFAAGETKVLRTWSREVLQIDFWQNIVWENYPQHVHIDTPSKLFDTLEMLLCRPLNETNQTVYVIAPGSYPYFLRTTIRAALNHYGSLFWSEAMLIWNPVEGYIIEDLSFGRITVGLVPKQPELNRYCNLRKETETYSFLRLVALCHIFFDSARTQVSLLVDEKANKILSFFQTKFPLTEQGKIDWGKIENRLVIGSDPHKIIPALEQLFGGPVSMTAYINWADPEFPLVKIDLREAINRYDQIVAVAPETMIFNQTARYVIEIGPSGIITVGVMCKTAELFTNPIVLKDSSSCTFFQTAVFRTFISTFGLTVCDDDFANQLLADFRRRVEFTEWGRVDWERYKSHTVVGEDIHAIIPALEKLLGRPVDGEQQVYLELVDPDMPLVKTSVKRAIESIPQTYHLSFDLFIFDPAMSYVIAVDPLRTITVGVASTN